jgi:peroxiredoxin
MKKIHLLLVSLLILGSCTNADQNEVEINTGFDISGTVENADDALSVKLQKRVDGEWVIEDSTQIVDKRFQLKGNVDLPELFYISVGEGRNYLQVFASQGAELTVAANMDSLNKADITGSPIQDKFKAYNDGLIPYNEKMKALYPQYDLADSLDDKELKATLDEKYEAISAEKNAYSKSVILKNLDNPMSAYLVSGIYYDDSKLEEMAALVNKFAPAIDSSAYTIRLKGMIDTWRKVSIGQPAIDFTQNDTTGAPVTLSSLKGQYVLIDFWASWCGPCRAENPNVVKLYNELHDKGFEIIGVSFDTKRDNWISAIHADELSWYHVSDLGGWKNAVGDLYAVRSIPHTILLDKEGVIIAKNLRGDELREKLEELLL